MSEQYFFKLKKKDKYKSVMAKAKLKNTPTANMKNAPPTTSQAGVADASKVIANPNSANTTTLSSLKVEEEEATTNNCANTTTLSSLKVEEEEATTNNFNSELTTETLNSIYVKNNEFLTRLINKFASRVNSYNQEGELFDPEHNKLLLSNTKMLAELIKTQTETILAKTTLQKSNNTINNTINYKDVMNVLHKRK
ncbi:hypothetical protein HPDP_00425 [Candidatus Hepatincola sp. Pdp]